MKLCVISNSHVVSLRQGWEQVNNFFPDTSITFFASHGITLTLLEVRKGTKKGSGVLYTQEGLVERVLEQTSGGLKQIDISQYDAFFVYGIKLRIPLIPIGTSDAVIQQTYYDCITLSGNYDVITKIKSINKSAKIFVGHAPLPARQMTPSAAYPPLGTALVPYDVVFNAIKTTLRQRNIILLSQPRSTIGEDLVTKQEYSKGSVRLDTIPGEQLGDHAQQDIRHMNADFGRLYWETHLPTILKAVEPKKQ